MLASLVGGIAARWSCIGLEDGGRATRVGVSPAVGDAFVAADRVVVAGGSTRLASVSLRQDARPQAAPWPLGRLSVAMRVATVGGCLSRLGLRSEAACPQQWAGWMSRWDEQ